MPLEKYKAKRNFKLTSEPKPKLQRHKGLPMFVVQEHHASRLHWDFRLQADGVLKSWAVTRQPTRDPAIKRLAVQVEDHPIEYAKFHGDIPTGQYGAGHVDIWDKGTYEPVRGLDVGQGAERGKVEVDLHGKKLKGQYTLVRMTGKSGGKHGENWLLIKRRDQWAQADGQTKTQKPSPTTAHRPNRTSPKKAAPSQPAGKPRPRTAAPEEVEYSHVQKLMFPGGITKGDVLQFYETISPWLLPYLEDRPVTAERVPEGVVDPQSPHFWQKNTPAYYPAWIPRVLLPSETGKQVQYALVNDRPALMYFVNQGTATFHVYFSRVRSLHRPDFVLFDLDPGAASFDDVTLIATELRRALDKDNIEPFVKTSGKTGLHVMTRWEKTGGYDEARAWATSIARAAEQSLPEIATTERSKSARKGRVYIDVMQNALGHHAVPPYVLRATPAATVSTPLDWKEVNKRLSPRKFTMEQVLKRLKRKGDLWEPIRNE